MSLVEYPVDVQTLFNIQKRLDTQATSLESMAEVLQQMLQALRQGLEVNMPSQILELPDFPTPQGVSAQELAALMAPIIQSLDMTAKFDELNESLRQVVKDSQRPQQAVSVPRFDTTALAKDASLVNLTTAVKGYYATKITVSGSVTYVAKAAVGSAQGSAVWQVQKIDETTGTVITWADGNAEFDNVATDLTALTYS